MRKIMRKVKSQWVVVGLSAVAILGVGAGAINFNSDNDENAETTPKVEKLDEGTANKTFIGDTDSEIVENEQFDDVHEESIAIETPTDSAKAFPSNYPAGTTFGGAVPLTYQSEDKTPEVLESPTSPIPTTTAATSNQNSQTVGSIPTPESPVTASPVGTETGTGTGNIEVFPDLDEIVQPGGESTPGNTDVSDSKTEELPTEDQEITEQVTTNTIDETVSVPFDTVYVEDESLLVGEEQIIQTGTMGIIVNTYTEVIRDEVQESYSLTNTVVVSNPLNQIVHIGVKELKQETKNISTSYETVYQSDTELEKGQAEVIQVGVMGESVETYNVTYVKGIKVAEELVGTEVVKEPVNQIITEGIKNIPVVTTKEEEKTIVVPYTTTEVEDASLESGKTEVRQEGVNGERVISEKVTLTDGIETDREMISDRVIVSAVNKVVAVGTKVVEKKTVTETENIVAYTTLKQEENSIPMGELQLVQPGLFGYDTVTYEVTYTNGVETGRVEIGRVTIVPVDEIVRIGMQVTETKTETVEENIVAFTTAKQEDNSFPTGQTEVIQSGVDGYDTVIYEVTYTNGIETGRTEVNRTTTAPIDEIVKVGTQALTVEDIIVTTAGDSSVLLNGKNIQMLANILPENITDKTVTWSVESKTGTASIDASGLLTANSAGTVLVKATANDGSGTFGTKEIAIAKPVSITGYEGIVNGELIIPDVIDGSKVVNGYYGDFFIGNILGVDELGIVTSIGENAFRAKQLTSVIIPDSVTNIGPGAFGDNQLTSAYIPEGVTTIGAGAFYINKLSEIIIPKGISIIERYTFGNNELTSVDIPNNVTIIHDAAFGNNKLNHVTLSEGLKIIRTGAFGSGAGTNQLTVLDIPDSVTEIGSYAFENNKLSIISIGSGVKIWDNALGGWNNYFRDAYEANGAGFGVYKGTQNGIWEAENPDIPETDSDGKPLSKLNISLLIDSTARIAESDPTNLRLSTAKRFVECLDADDLMEVVGNDISIQSTGFTDDTDTLNSAIDSIVESRDMEDFFAAATGLGHVLQNGQLNSKEGEKAIVMFTDGRNEDWLFSGSFYSLFDDNIDDAVEHDVTVYIIGVGEERNKSFLQSAANKTGGRYIDVEDTVAIDSLILELSYADEDKTITLGDFSATDDIFLAFSQLAYELTDEKEGITVENWMSDAKLEENKKSLLEKIQKWKIIKSEDEGEMQFGAVACEDGNNIVVAFEGTNPRQLGDVLTDVADVKYPNEFGQMLEKLSSSTELQETLLSTTQLQQAISFTKDVIKNMGENIDFNLFVTGHSLGGWLAQQVAAAFIYPDPGSVFNNDNDTGTIDYLKKAITIASPNFTDDNLPQDPNGVYQNYIFNYSVKEDIIVAWGGDKYIGSHKSYDFLPDDEDISLKYHYLESYAENFYAIEKYGEEKNANINGELV